MNMAGNLSKYVRCANCGWIGSLTEAHNASVSVIYEDGITEDGEPFYDEDNAYPCPNCHEETLEVFYAGKRLGSMYIYG